MKLSLDCGSSGLVHAPVWTNNPTVLPFFSQLSSAAPFEMDASDPLKSLTIDPSLLRDYATVQSRGSGKPYALITTKMHPRLPLAIHNYTNRAFSRQTWDSVVVAARTLVTEVSTGKIVSRSFSKFFNHHEKLAYKPTGNEHAFVIEEKVDGSIISLFYYGREWIMVSRSSFDSPHTVAACKILNEKYPKILNNLDQSKTYVFELVDPSMPIKIVYKTSDLVLLSIVSKDGQELPVDFDWTTLPFPRPRVHQTSVVNPKVLSKLNITNEEGFVVKFWRSAHDRHPQRIKVKFESYLQATGSSSLIQSMSKISIQSPTKDPVQFSSEPPSHESILAQYLDHRSKIHHFRTTTINNKMEAYQSAYLLSLEAIADDYGGQAWIDRVERVWNRIHACVSLQEGEWKQLTARLEQEGYKPGSVKAQSDVIKQAFYRRIKKSDIDSSYRLVLLAWFSNASPIQQVDLFIKSLSISMDFRSATIIL